MEDSIEPSYEAIREVIEGLGFRMEVSIPFVISLNIFLSYRVLAWILTCGLFALQKEDTHVKTRYAQNTNSMLQYEYNSVYFVCRKPKLNVSGDFSNHLNGLESNGIQEQEN